MPVGEQRRGDEAGGAEPGPAGQGIEAVRPIRDAIKARVEQLLTELPVRTG